MPKYGNKKTAYQGNTYDSKKESRYALQLDLKRHAVHDQDRVVDWKPQVPYPIVINGKQICSYIADFVVTYANGRVEVVDVKSAFTAKLPVYRLKKKLVEAVYGITIIEEI